MSLNNKNIIILETLLNQSDNEVLVNRLVYKIPKKYLDFIKTNNFKFSNFINEAIAEKIEMIKQKEVFNVKK